MTYKDLKKQREYQRKWMKKRREDWLTKNGPCIWCGVTKNLQIDHKDPSKKVSHNIWSWAEKRRKAELKKCQILCKSCHKLKTEINLEGTYKTTRKEVEQMRKLYKKGISHRKLSAMFGISYGHVGRIIRKEHWA